MKLESPARFTSAEEVCVYVCIMCYVCVDTYVYNMCVRVRIVEPL